MIVPYDSEHPAWEQLPGESPEEYANFQAYVQLGPRRSIVMLSRQLGISTTTLGKQLHEFHWKDRAVGYSQFLAEVDIDERVRKFRDEMRLEETTGQLCIAKGLARLKDIDPSRLTVKQAIDLVDIGIKIKRIALGNPSQESIDALERGYDSNAPKFVITFVDKDKQTGEIVDVEMNAIGPGSDEQA